MSRRTHIEPDVTYGYPIVLMDKVSDGPGVFVVIDHDAKVIKVARPLWHNPRLLLLAALPSLALITEEA